MRRRSYVGAATCDQWQGPTTLADVCVATAEAAEVQALVRAMGQACYITQGHGAMAHIPLVIVGCHRREITRRYPDDIAIKMYENWNVFSKAVLYQCM